MKIIGNIIRWILSVFLILLGLLLMVSVSLSTGVFCILAGVFVFPPVVNKVPEFKHKKGILNICSIIAFIMSVASISVPEASETVLVEDTTATTSQLEETSQSNLESLSNEETSQSESTAQLKDESKAKEKTQSSSDTVDREELAEWLEEKLSQSESVTDKERKKWKKVKEEEFLTVWKEVVLQEVNSYEDDYAGVVSCVEQAEMIYGEFYSSDGKQISDIKQDVADLSEILDENKKIKIKYGSDIEKISLNYKIENFYISQRLEQSYSDNILGKLQKEYDSYQPEDSSDWVAYDVEYDVWNTPTAGDTFRILHADSVNPFTQKGVYEVAYYDTGNTTQISSSGGFVQEVPICQLIENMDEFENDINQYYENFNLCVDRYNILIQALGGEASVLEEPIVPQYMPEESWGNGDFFIGEWVDANSESLYMEITCDDGVHYIINISDRLSSSEFINWSFVGVYDASIDGLVYSNGERWDIYQLEKTLVYDDGSGALLRGEDNLFSWRDDKENYGEISCFMPSGD